MPAPIEVTVDAKGMPLPPVDPNVAVPNRVKAEADRAAALHAQAYGTNQPVTSAVTPAPQAQPQPQPQPQISPQPVNPQPQPLAQPVSQGEPDRSNWDAAQWMQHAKSMEGRFRQAKEQVTTLQSNISELGEELLRTQAAPRGVSPQRDQPPAPVQPLITQQDVETYGEDFLNVAQRAALQAVQPRITQLEQRNQTLERQLRKTTIQSIEAVLDANVPNWPQINLSPRFKEWLNLRDVYSGQVRRKLLNEAHQAADAARVLSFFQGFIADEEATGSTEFLPRQEPSPQATPHQPAVELTSLAAPGHARPAQGTQPNTPANEPIWITRGQISQFYENVRKGVYRGRDQDYHNDQAIIFECQRAGRVR
jgi:hypothetical protein